MQRKQKRRNTPTLEPDEGAEKPPTKFGEQVTGDHFIKNGDGSDAEAGPSYFLATP